MKTSACILAILMLAACANNPPAAQPPLDWDQIHTSIPAGKARVFVVRPMKALGANNTYRISINGKAVVDIPIDTYATFTLPAGEYKVSARTLPNVRNTQFGYPLMERPYLDLDAKNGEMIFIHVYAAGLTEVPGLSLVTPEVGEPLVQHARHRKGR